MLFKEKKVYEVVPITKPIDVKHDKPKEVKYHHTKLSSTHLGYLHEDMDTLRRIGYEVYGSGIIYDKPYYTVTMRKAVGFKEDETSSVYANAFVIIGFCFSFIIGFLLGLI